MDIHAVTLMVIIQIPLALFPTCLTQNPLNVIKSRDNEKAETDVKRKLCSVVFEVVFLY